MTQSHPLDGAYLVTTTNDSNSSKSDGQTIIENGQTCRLDESNCKWTSNFEIISETEVKMTSIADPAEANPDFYLTAPNGAPTREAITYESILKLARKGDKIQISGQIDHGENIVFITMRKV